jgi:signal transduction protein with GAF and PtsI domain
VSVIRPVHFIVPVSVEGVVLADWALGDPIIDDSVLVVGEWSPANALPMLRCRGVVVLDGVITSHAAIMAREMSLPSCLHAGPMPAGARRVSLVAEAGIAIWN